MDKHTLSELIEMAEFSYNHSKKAGAHQEFLSEDKTVLIKAKKYLKELSEGTQTNSEPANCAIFDVSKRYRFTMQDVDTNEIIIIDEDTERKAFKKAFRFFSEKKLKGRELSIVSKVDNVC